MRRVRATLPVIVALAVLLSPSQALAQRLDTVLERLRQSTEAADATIGWAVVALDGDPDQPGRLIASRDPQASFIPASNMKVLTTGTALRVLGPDFVWTTDIGLAGDRLVVVGSGDPAFADPKLLDRMDPPRAAVEFLDVIASAVAGEVSEVSEIVIDDRIFDRELVHPVWPREQLHKQYCAEVAGLNFHTNVLRFYPRPSGRGAGAAPGVRIEPEAPWIVLRNNARTVTSGQNSFWLTREHGSNDFALHGQISKPSGYAAEVTVHDPALFFARLLEARLRNAGVRVDSSRGTSEVRRAGPGEAIEPDKVLVRVTTSMADVVERTNTDSKNLYGEALLKRLAHEVTGEPGSWGAGAAVVRMTLTEVLGADLAARTVVSDGSGMSRDNRASPHVLARWLEAMSEDDETGELFIDSLASPGRGTLRKRFLDRSGRAETGLDLRAKSGYLNGVRTLSGYLRDPETGTGVAFSILINDSESGKVDRACRKFLDDAVLAMDEWLDVRIPEAAAVSGG